MTISQESYTPEVQPSLRLKRFNVTSLNFQVKEEHWQNSDVTNNTQYTLKFTVIKTSSESEFQIKFETILYNEDKSFLFETTFVSIFESINISLTSEFFESSFITANAPAIVFPYIRAFITNSLQNSGYNPVILPSFNFTKLNKIE